MVLHFVCFYMCLKLCRYCGLKIPPSTTSTTNLMTVKFRSDDSVHREGFTAHYVMIDTTKGLFYQNYSVLSTLIVLFYLVLSFQGSKFEMRNENDGL